jgi:hypothetical protein
LAKKFFLRCIIGQGDTMAFIFVDADNSLAVRDVYAHRKIVSDIGGTWDPISKLWRVAFTTYNLDYLLTNLENVTVSADMDEHIQKQIEKEERLSKLRAMSKQDIPVRFKIPGLRGNLYNYQRLGVMFSTTNGFGTLLADEMGLGKSLQAIASALYLKSKGLAKHALVITPASLKFNWPIEIEKFTNEKYVVVDGTPEERIAQWLRTDVFFTIVNYELVLEDLFGGREFKDNKEDDVATKVRKAKQSEKAKQRERILTPVRTRMWDFLAIDECFPYSTPIMTDRGILPIGYIVENYLTVSVLSCDFSRSELSYKKVVRWIGKVLTGNLIEVTHEYGKFVCTANHKIWTEEYGYVQAGELSNRGSETHLRIVSSGIQCSQKRKGDTEVLFQEVSWGNPTENASNGRKDLCLLSRTICYFMERIKHSKVLFKQLFRKVENVSARDCEQDTSQSDAKTSKIVQGMSDPFYCEDDKRTGKDILFQKMQCDLENKVRSGVGCEDGKDAEGICNSLQGNQESQIIREYDAKESRPNVQAEGNGRCSRMEEDTSIIPCKGRETIYNNSAAEIVSGVGFGMGNGTCGCRQAKNGRSDNVPSELLSGRYCSSRVEDSNRSGWQNTQNEQMENHRRQEKQGFISSRLVGTKILERTDYERYGISNDENTRVYNLEVQDNHNYVANGVLVSNCHALKSHSSRRSRNVKALRAKFRMALTGTPMDGRLEELHSVMGFVAPGLLGSKARFFQMHIETDFWGRVTGYKRLAEVSKRIEPYFIRRLKKEVLKDLPDKIYENRIVSLTTEEKKIYKSLAEGGHAATEDEQAIVACIRCKQFCNWPEMIDEDCKSSSKMDAFKEILEEVVIQNGHKALIFSQYKTMLNIIADVLQKMGLKYLRIDGDTDKKERAKMQAQFNTDPTIDLMIGTEAMSQGLNFTGADYVINYDDNWSPSIMGQREDRCHRIGQKNVVTVINFICKDTIEERIRDVIYGKNKITAEVLGDSTDEVVLKRLNPKEVAKLL